MILYKGCDNLIRLDLLKDEATDAYVNDATVAFTLKDIADAAVAGATSVSMVYVTASNGRYQGTLQDTVSLTVGSAYYLEVTASKSGVVAFRRIECHVEYKGAD
jgi:hypothetical protein